MTSSTTILRHRPMFSVVMNNYNYARYIGEAVDSVLAQSYPDFELIVVDDGSTDGSVDILRKYEDSRIRVIDKQNGGQLSTFNVALPHIRGKITCFLDADDSYKPDYLQTIAHLYPERDCDFVFCNMTMIGNQQGDYLREKRPIAFGSTYYLTLHSRIWIGGPTSCLSVKTSFLKKLPELESLEKDWDHWLDVLLNWGTSLTGAAKHYDPRPMVNYRIHGGNHSLQNKKDVRKVKKAAVDRFFRKFPKRRYFADFFPLLREFFHSPVPLEYKPILNSYFWLPGRLLCRMVARTKYRPQLTRS